MDEQHFIRLFQAEPPLEIRSSALKQFIAYVLGLCVCVLTIMLTILLEKGEKEPFHLIVTIGIAAAILYIMITAVWQHNAKYKLVLTNKDFSVAQLHNWNPLTELKNLIFPKDYIFQWILCSEFTTAKSKGAHVIQFIYGPQNKLYIFIPPDYVTKPGYEGAINGTQIAQLMNRWRKQALAN